MAINIKVSEQYQGVIESAGDPQNTTLDSIQIPLTWDTKPIAANFGVGQAWFSDIGAMGYSDGVNWTRRNSEIITKKIALIGDSTCFQNSSATAYLIQGPVSQALALLGYPVEFYPSDNYGIGGSTTRSCIDTQIPLLRAGHATNNYSHCFISVGTNDTTLTLSERITVTSELFNAVRALGMIPISVGIRPRGADAADTTAKQTARSLNKWIYNQSLAGLVEYIDITSAYADTSTAFGNIIVATSADSLHPNAVGASLEARLIYAALNGKLGAKTLQFASEPADIFDRTNNPYGVCMGSNTNPTLAGGTTAPTGFTTSGGTWSKVNRTLDSGEVRSDPQCVLAASTVHNLQQGWVASGDWDGTTELKPGDIVEARAKVVVTSGVNISRIELRLTESNGPTPIDITCFNDPGASKMADGTYTLYLKTPPRTIRAYGGSSNASLNNRLLIQTIAGASGTVQVHALEVRPIYLA